MKVHIRGVDPPDPMLAHEDGDVGIVQYVAAEVSELLKGPASHLRMPSALHKNTR